MHSVTPLTATPREWRAWSRHLVQGVPPHVAPCQGLVVGEDHGVVLGVGLVAALADPAAVVRERVMKAPVPDGEVERPVTAMGPDGEGRARDQGPRAKPDPRSLRQNPARGLGIRRCSWPSIRSLWGLEHPGTLVSSASSLRPSPPQSLSASLWVGTPAGATSSSIWTLHSRLPGSSPCTHSNNPPPSSAPRPAASATPSAQWEGWVQRLGPAAGPGAVWQAGQGTGTGDPANSQQPPSLSSLTASSSKKPSGFQGRLLSKLPWLLPPPHHIPQTLVCTCLMS